MPSPGIAALQQIAHWNGIGRHDLALERARAALQQEPGDPDLLVALGVALHGLHRMEEAEAAARSALHHAPGDVDALMLLAQIAQETGRNREAEEHLLAALAEDAGNPGLLAAYAHLLYRTGHLEKAERLVRAALARDAEYAGAHSLLALILGERATGQREARAHGREAVHLEPGSDGSHAVLGIHELATGRPFAARRHLREALRLDPTDPGIQEAYLEADRATRWIYLPMYYWSLLVQRLPGQQWAIWGALMLFLLIAPRTGLDEDVWISVLKVYLVWMVYTWIAIPLARLWVRWRPAQ